VIPLTTTNAAKSAQAPSTASDATHSPEAVPAGANSERPFGPDAATILASEHFSLIGSRSLIWSEAMSRATVFLTVLSASIIALAFLANATSFGPQTTTFALVLLPVVLFLGLATYMRLVQINGEEFQLVLAMNRLRHAYLTMAPGLEPFFTTSRHDDERGIATTYMIYKPTELRLWLHILVNTPTVVATIDAALATVIVALLLRVAEASTVAVVAAAGATFIVVLAMLIPMQRHTLRPLRHPGSPRFPSPPDVPPPGERPRE
jgi:hypothetical protein